MTSDYGILGCAYAMPPTVRGNDDPIFARLRFATGWDSAETFAGVEHRRVLAAEESIETYMAQAATAALAEAGVATPEVERIYGCASVSTHLTPNGLYLVHGLLGLPSDAWVIPVNVEFSTFLAALILATEAGNSGACRHALVTCGSNWTRHLDYAKGHAFTAGDAAAAAVLGPLGRLVVADHVTQTFSDLFDALTMSIQLVDVDRQAQLALVYRMDSVLGARMFTQIMRDKLADVVLALLARNGISPADITLITHQGSQEMIDHWRERIQPSAYAESLRELGNMTLATYPVNLARVFATLSTPFVVLASPGTGCHLTALLLRHAR